MADSDFSERPSDRPGPAEPTTPATSADQPHQSGYDGTASFPAAPGYGDTARYPEPAPLGAPQSYQPQGYGGYSPYVAASYPTPASPAAGAQYGPMGPGSSPGAFGAAPTDTSGGYPAAGSADAARRKRGLIPLLSTALIAALIGGVVGAATVAIADRNRGTVDTGLKITNETSAPAAKTDGTVGGAASKIRASVATINVSSSQAAGTGSGVIIRADGYILTNDHVISTAANGGTITVVLTDGRSSKATIVGRDTSDDLAVIKVQGLSGLTAATFGRSSSLSVGQTVVAVGAPLGLSDTVTSGIVSNTARPVRSGDNDQAVFQAIQTDAAINPGNSGGPLVDLNGSVVGINAAIATDNSGGGLQIPGQTQQSGNIGIGFAIPSDEASRIASELIANGKAYHAVLGVSVRSTSSTTGAGVSLSSVSAGGAAQKAGLAVGDVITAVDSDRVTTADSLIAAVRSHAPGEKVTVAYARNGKALTATVTLDKSDT